MTSETTFECYYRGSPDFCAADDGLTYEFRGNFGTSLDGGGIPYAVPVEVTTMPGE